MQEMDELYKDCPTHTNTYEVDGVKHKVVSHFVAVFLITCCAL